MARVLLAMRGGHSRAEILTKSLCQLSRSVVKPLNNYGFLERRAALRGSMERGPNLALQ
jgi:hypothetical protein